MTNNGTKKQPLLNTNALAVVAGELLALITSSEFQPGLVALTLVTPRVATHLPQVKAKAKGEK